jgi:predicted ester cyclase
VQTAMAESDNKRLVLKLYEQGWGAGNLDVIDQVFAFEHVLHWNEMEPTEQKRTSSEVKEIVREYRKALPDLRVEVNQLVAEGSKVAVQVTFIGTHQEPYEGFEPTNKPSLFTDMQILKFVDGKIVESFLGSGGLGYFYRILNGEAFKR